MWVLLVFPAPLVWAAGEGATRPLMLAQNGADQVAPPALAEPQAPPVQALPTLPPGTPAAQAGPPAVPQSAPAPAAQAFPPPQQGAAVPTPQPGQVRPQVPGQPPQIPGQAQRPAQAPAPGQVAPLPVLPGTPGAPVAQAPAGQVETPQAPPPPQPARGRRPMVPGGGQPLGGGGAISLNFDDADVFSVVQTVFGDILRVNYVVDPRIKGRVTFRSVAPITREQVLPVMEVILRLNAIGVVEDAGLYRIVPLAEVSREPSPVSFGRDPNQIPVTGKSMIQVVPVVYLQSTEVVKLITPFLSANAVCLDVPKSNQIIVVDTDASVRRILTLIETFDNEKQKKKRATVYVYPVQNGKAREIANLLNQIFLGARPMTSTGLTGTTGLSGAGLSTTGARPGGTTPGGAPSMTTASALPTPSIAQPMMGTMGRGPGAESLVSEITRIFSDDTINSVIVLATPEDYETIKETIAKVDIVPRQVVIEGVIAQINLQDELSLGLAYSMNLQMTIGAGSIGGPIGLNGASLQGIDPTKQSGSGFTFFGTDRNGVVRAYVSALASESKAKVLAAPHILVSDNREARIQVGQQVPILTSETFGSGTVAPQRTVQYKDIGIILKVKPQINESGVVSMEVSQEVSTYETITLFSNETNIVLDKTEASSNLVVRDGQTIIIGGLIREDHTKSGSGIPFLRNIPVLGYLFGSTSRKTTRTEIIILLTPHVIKSEREARSITSDYVDNITGGATVRGGLKKDELLKSGVQIRRGLAEPGGLETPYVDNPPPDVVVPFPKETPPKRAPLQP